MTTVPRLSIGLPVYNGEPFLVEALDSLLGQSYQDFELIISDNASTDGTEGVCRRYAAQDSRIRYVRQPRNIGCAPNHNFVVEQARGELFKWAASDDRYAPNLLQRCIEALDEHPHVVLAHSWTAMIDSTGTVTQAVEYPLATASRRAPERFRSALFGDGGDDDGAVIRTDVLRRVAPIDSYHHADRTIVAELALHGPFHQVPDWLYLRRDHPGRAERACPTLRSRCANLDPRRGNRLRHPAVRLLAEYVWGYVAAIRRAPLSSPDRRECFRDLARWLARRAAQGSLTGPAPAHGSPRPARRLGCHRTRPRKEILGASHRLTAPRVGLFGLLGSGNIGNDGSLDAVLGYLRSRHPEAIVDARCAGPEQVTTRYGVEATPLHWYRFEYQTASGMQAIVMKGLGKIVDAFRTASWVRRHDVVIVPGMGVLEATLPVRPWGFPYSLLLACAAGRLFGCKVALVSVGANVVEQRATRRLFTAAARLAHYRSFRDILSRDAMRRMGLDTSNDEVYPDLVFSLPTPPDGVGTAGTVGVGVMDYNGGNDDRRHADEIHASYVEKMKRFVRWLVDNDRRVRLFTGDQADDAVVREILVDLEAHRPDLDPSWAVAEPVSSLAELMRQMASVDTVVATRYHNVLCALKLCKPTVSLGYAVKNDVLMADMGLAEFCQPVRALDVDRLIEQLTALEKRSGKLQPTMTERNLTAVRRLERQFAVLSAALFPGAGPAAVDPCR